MSYIAVPQRKTKVTQGAKVITQVFLKMVLAGVSTTIVFEANATYKFAINFEYFNLGTRLQSIQGIHRLLCCV